MISKRLAFEIVDGVALHRAFCRVLACSGLVVFENFENENYSQDSMPTSTSFDCHPFVITFWMDFTNACFSP